jgi:hypothetical protein
MATYKKFYENLFPFYHFPTTFFVFCFIARPSSTCDMYIRYNKQYRINGSVDIYRVNNQIFNRCRAP